MGTGETGSCGEIFLNNPAAILKTTNYFLFSHYSYSSNIEAGTFAIEYFNYRRKTNQYSFGLDFLFQHEEPIPEYDAWNVYQGDILIQNYSSGLNFAKKIHPNIDVGFTLRYFRKNFFIPSSGSTVGQGIGFDFGFAGKISDVSWGIAYQNIGPKITYTPAEERQDDLPRQMRLGVSKIIWTTSSELLELFSDVVWADADVCRLRLGTQYSWQNSFFLRFGYVNKESSDGAISGFTGGLGIKIKNISLDLASGVSTPIGTPVLISLTIQ